MVMSQSMATTTTPPLMAVCSSASFITTMVMMAPFRTQQQLASASYGSAATADSKGHTRCCWPCHHCATATSISYACSVICQPCHGSSTGEFFFIAKPPTYLLVYNGVCYSVCFLLSDSNVDTIFTYGGSSTEVCTTTALPSIPVSGICTSW